MPGVAIKDLTRHYGDVAAVNALSLDVKPGDEIIRGNQDQLSDRRNDVRRGAVALTAPAPRQT